LFDAALLMTAWVRKLFPLVDPRPSGSAINVGRKKLIEILDENVLGLVDFRRHVIGAAVIWVVEQHDSSMRQPDLFLGCTLSIDAHSY
jgi:hypothetical protein